MDKDKWDGKGSVVVYLEEKQPLVVGELRHLSNASNDNTDYCKTAGPLIMNCSVRIRTNKKAYVAFGKWLGLLREPKTTYKTIRKQRAKRNMR